MKNTKKDDILDHNFKIIQSDMKDLIKVTKELSHDLHKLRERTNYLEDKNPEVKRVDDHLTGEQIKRIRK